MNHREGLDEVVLQLVLKYSSVLRGTAFTLLLILLFHMLDYWLILYIF